MQNNKNFILFIVLSLAVMYLGMWVTSQLNPPPKKAPEEAKAVQAEPDKEKDKQEKEKEKQLEVEPPKPRPKPPAVVPPSARKLITLGTNTDNLTAMLDPRGAGVRRVVLNKFQQADAMGRPEWIDLDGKKIPRPLELVREDLNRDNPSHLLFHYDPARKGHDPLPDLGREYWNVVESTEEDGVVRRVAFAAEVDGVRITKTYSLQPEDYHIGLEVKLEHASDADEKPIPFRYQLTSAHGLRIEGEWYTYVLRNALIGYRDVKRDTFARTLEDSRRIGFRLGGDPVDVTDGDKQIRYAAVAVQYFASAVVVDNEQANQNFLGRARPTLEGSALRGRVKSIAEDRQRFVLLGHDNIEYAFYLGPGRTLPLGLKEGEGVGIVYTTDEYDRRLALEFRSEEATEPLFYHDIQVRVATEPLEVKPGAPLVHRYLLYNGPVKVKLLSYLEGDKAVAQGLVDRYEDTLHLNTLTDYPSPGVGEFFSKFYWTDLLILCTNIMHRVLWALHTYLMPWSYGLAIIMLTVLVRGMMFPISRKQAMTSVRMQALAPELKKLQEKYKNDRQALGMAQMELYRKHGVNPLGTCWLLFLQMPIFLGLYYCLQESIMFRLAPFLWIQNLAAPDMLFYWSQQIPWISRPIDYGSFLYLGPYFNLLPVIAVALMIVQQSLMAPPAVDEQQQMQMKMMKYMMIVFGLFFYKVAAGLCVYFIASSLWGFAERKLLPKRKPEPGALPPEQSDSFLQRVVKRLRGQQASQPPVTASAAQAIGPVSSISSTSRRKARRKGKGSRDGAVTSAAASPDGMRGKVQSWWTGLREWWAELLRQAEKK